MTNHNRTDMRKSFPKLFVKILLRNKPIRRSGTTPMGFLVCAAMMSDSSSVTAFAKEKPGSRDGDSRKTSITKPLEGEYGFK